MLLCAFLKQTPPKCLHWLFAVLLALRHGIDALEMHYVGLSLFPAWRHWECISMAKWRKECKTLEIGLEFGA